ncbi:MAG: PCMD domain-containing protein [Bacteroidota bacterium]
MKKTLLFSLLVAFSSMMLNAQTYYPDNGDMELWTTISTYEHPNGWDSPNEEMATFSAGTVVTKSTDANSGTYSAAIETKLVFGLYTVPGVLVNGDFSANIAAGTIDIKGGDPFTNRPEKFKGFYKYTPATGDSCIIVAGLFKRNGSTGARDTIAYATFYQSGTVSAWTEFEVNFDYQSSEDPDSILIVASASNAGAPVATSVLFVDDFSLTGTVVGISEMNAISVNIFSNPAKDLICIQNIPVDQKDYSLAIYNSIGSIVYVKKFSNQSDLSVDVSSFNKGLYIVELIADSQKTVKKIIIN